MLGALALRRKSHIGRLLIFPHSVAGVVQFQNLGGLPVHVVLKRLGKLLLLGGELANDFTLVDRGRGRGGGHGSCRGLILGGTPDRQAQRRKQRHLGKSMHVSLFQKTFPSPRRFPYRPSSFMAMVSNCMLFVPS